MVQQELVDDLKAKFGEALSNFEEPHGITTLEVNTNSLLNVVDHLISEGFTFLTDICGIHLPDRKGEEFGIIYHLHNLPRNVRIRLKVFVSQENIHVPTLTERFSSANWMERETFDFYGIIFDGHPNLKRILNMDDMDYHPMRKEYPLEDATRQDKIDALFGR